MIDLLNAYMQLCFGAKIKTKSGQVYDYFDIKDGATATYSDFIRFIKKLKAEEPKMGDKYIQLELF